MADVDRDERFAMYFPNESEGALGGGIHRRQLLDEKSGQDSSITRIADSVSESGVTVAPTPLQGESSAEEKGCSVPTPTSKLQYRLWRVLFSNINRSVDEFYRLAEEESNEEKCHEMLALLAATTRDFSKLLERLEGFRALEPHTAGVSWEVRKPMRSSGVRSSGSSATSPQLDTHYQPKQGQQSAEGSTPEVSSVPSSTSKKLSATAIPFQPSHMVFSVPVAVNCVGKSNASPVSGTPHPVHPPLETETLNTTSDLTDAATSADNDSYHSTGGGLYIETADISESQTSTPSHSPHCGSASTSTATNSRKTSYVTRSSRTIHSAGEIGGKSADLAQSCRVQATAVTPGSPTRIEEWDADTEAQVVLASERVWAEAEAWVEAEAQAEEEAWQRLQSKRGKIDDRVNRGGSLSVDPVAGEVCSDGRFASGCYYLNSPMVATLDVRRRLLASPDLQKSEDSDFDSGGTNPFSSTVFSSAKHVPATSITTSQDDVPFSASVIDPAPKLLFKSIMSINPDAAEEPYPQIGFSPHEFVVSANRYFANENHNQDSFCGPYTSGTHCSVTAGSSVLRLSTPSTGASGHSTPHTGGSGSRSLHEKLSSPDRRRTLSPSEAKRKHEARQIAAESNRDRSVNERIQKAMIASERVRLRGEKEAQRLAQAEQALEDRLKDAEKRHFEHIKTIRGKAGNENAKVSEVMFINNLNGEGIAAELQRRLEEAEARILAAGLRRQERITSILEKGQRKSSHKSQQMSALRLQLETKKMERWSKLQSRLEAVQRRRNARLEEMKRRSEEEEQEAARFALESAVVSGAPREDAKLATSSTSSRRPAGESSKNKEKKRKSKARKATELEHKLDEELFAEFSAASQTISAVAAASKSIRRSACVEYSGADMPLEWVGPGGAEDPQQINMSGAYMTLHATQAKRVVQLARVCALGSEPNTILKTEAAVEQLLMPVVSSGVCWGASGSARITSLWPESGGILLRILQSASLGVDNEANFNNETRLLLMSLGFVAKEGPLLQLVAHSEKSRTVELDDSDPETINPKTVMMKKIRKKKKKKQEVLSSSSVILQPDCEYGRLAKTSHADDTSARSPRIILTPSAINGMGKAFSKALYSSKSIVAVNDVQSAAAASYAKLGGALLLRAFLGTELGCLSSPMRAAEFVPTEAFLAASKVSTWISCSSGEARDVLLVLGTGVALADVVHMLLLQLENWWRRARHQGDINTGSSKDAGVDTSAGRTCSSVFGYCAPGEEALGLTGSSTDRKPTKCYTFPQVNCREPVQPWIAVQASALPHLLRTLDALVRHVPPSAISDQNSAKHRQDALLWYIFSSGLPTVLGSTLQVLRALGSAATSLSFFRALTCHVPELLAGMVLFLRRSSGMLPSTIVSSVSQLGARKHSHPRGPQMVSLLRSSHIVDSLVLELEATLAHHRPVSSTIASTATVPHASLGASTALVRALVSLAALDIGFVQNLTHNLKESLASSMHFLLCSLLGPYWEAEQTKSHLPVSLLSPNAPDPLSFKANHAAAALHQLLALIGFCCVRNVAMQTKLATESQVQGLKQSSGQEAASGLGSVGLPTLVFLCKHMPPNYYLHEQFRSQLLPTIAAMCIDSMQALQVLRREMDTGLVSTHLASLCRDLEDFKRDYSALSSDAPPLQPKANLVEVAFRFPTELWLEAYNRLRG